MKNLYYISIVCTIFSIVSCNLNEFPKDKLAPENYFNTEDELRTYTNTFYQQNLPSASAIYSEGADLIICTTLQEEVSGTRVVINDGGEWDTGSWNPLTYINTYLHYSGRCANTSIRNRYDGVARFFRAYFYFQKVKRFGDVPWYDDIIGSDNSALYKERDPREYVMQKILLDIDFAIANLPTTKSVYEITTWTALALKSRICLFEGTYRKYHNIPDSEKYLRSCAEASEFFINNSPYRIYTSGDTPYRDLFAAKNATTTSDEVILARDYDKGLNIVHNANHYTLSSTYGMPGVNKKLIDSYLMKDGSRFTDNINYTKLEFYDEMQNRDPRLTQTVRGPGYRRIGGTKILGPDFASSTTGYNLIKWVSDETQDGYNNSFNDIIIFRAAEIYLNFAEAKAELGTITQADLDKSILPIRNRVKMPNIKLEVANANPDPFLSSKKTGYTNVTGPNTGVILEIRRERTIELVDEGHRYYDMIRWKEGKRFEEEFNGMYFTPFEAGKNYRVYDFDGNGVHSELDICLYTDTKPSVPGVNTFIKIGDKFNLTDKAGGNIIVHDTKNEPRKWREDRDYLYPIPLSQILLNNNIKQNPKWDE